MHDVPLLDSVGKLAVIQPENCCDMFVYVHRILKLARAALLGSPSPRNNALLALPAPVSEGSHEIVISSPMAFAGEGAEASKGLAMRYLHK